MMAVNLAATTAQETVKLVEVLPLQQTRVEEPPQEHR